MSTAKQFKEDCEDASAALRALGYDVELTIVRGSWVNNLGEVVPQVSYTIKVREKQS
jgi:hypothetical protein